MMGAREIVAALGGTWRGTYGTCKCPAHDDRAPSLSVAERDGRVLVRCHAGCEQGAILDALRGRGLWSGDDTGQRPDPAAVAREQARREAETRKRIEAARRLWAEGRPAKGSPVADYLRGRGITLPPPPTLRFHPSVKHGATGLFLPAMLAAVCRWPGREVVAVHRTFLRQGRDGWGKAPVSPCKLMLGPVAGGAVRLAPPGPVLAVGEGVETCAAFMEATGLPTWAALSTSGLEGLALPSVAEVPEVVIAADNDESGAGQRAAEWAAGRWEAEGRRVRIVMPPKQGTDFNDVLRGAA